MDTEARAVLFTGPDQVEVGTVTMPEPGAGEVLLEIAYSCISPGTDLRVLAGKQWGAQPWPLIPGYSQVGRILKCGPDVNLEEGLRVFAMGTRKVSANVTWGAHLSHSVVRAEALYPLADEVSYIEASVSKLAAIALQGVQRSRLKPGEEVAVVGLGPIGLLSAVFHRHLGGKVLCLDVSQSRVDFARSMGFEAAVPEGHLKEAYASQRERGPDVVVDSTGVEAVLEQCVALAKELSWGDGEEESTRVVLQGSYPGRFEVDYETAFRRELELIVPRDHRPKDLHYVLGALQKKEVNLRPLVSKVVPAEEAASAYAELRESKAGTLTVALCWNPHLDGSM